MRRGDVLVRLDDTDARIAVANAEAKSPPPSAGFRRCMRPTAASAPRSRGAERTKPGRRPRSPPRRADLEKARIDLGRRQALASTGAVSQDELTSVRTAYDNAGAALRAAQAAQAQSGAARSAAVGERDANRALIANSTVDNNPEVLAAAAALAQARVDLERTVIRAPIDGVVSRAAGPGRPARPARRDADDVVPVQAAYVDANFKEVQLAKVRPGQTVELTSDLYGEDVVFHGRVAGFSGGTGAAFALVPAQNATGNWIKVVQRLPVRIKLDPKQLQKHPLRVGLSMNADVASPTEPTLKGKDMMATAAFAARPVAPEQAH